MPPFVPACFPPHTHTHTHIHTRIHTHTHTPRTSWTNSQQLNCLLHLSDRLQLAQSDRAVHFKSLPNPLALTWPAASMRRHGLYSFYLPFASPLHAYCRLFTLLNPHLHPAPPVVCRPFSIFTLAFEQACHPAALTPSIPQRTPHLNLSICCLPAPGAAFCTGEENGRAGAPRLLHA